MKLQSSLFAAPVAPVTLAALLFLASCSAEIAGDDTNSGGLSAAGSNPGGSSGTGGSAGAATVGGGGAGGSSAGVASGGTPGGTAAVAVEPSFNTLKSIIPMSCFGGLCHDLPENPLQLKLDDKLYATLTSHVTEHCGPVIKPGSPQDSAIIKLLKGPCGETDRMPFGKCFQDGDEGCISPDNIAALEKWIANGAPP
jgi:hypothetical protein